MRVKHTQLEDPSTLLVDDGKAKWRSTSDSALLGGLDRYDRIHSRDSLSDLLCTGPGDR